MTHNLFSGRSSGILLHPSSLPGSYGGDLGPEAYRFIDFLCASGQRWWQMLPMGPTGACQSPYDSPSAFAGNPDFISLERLVAEGLLTPSALHSKKRINSSARHGQISWEDREFLWKLSYRNFATKQFPPLNDAFRKFCRTHDFWLKDYSLYCAIRDLYPKTPWSQWPSPLRSREPTALAKIQRTLHANIDFHRYLQFLFDRQWKDLHSYAAKKNIRLIGDVAIFVARESADVWAHPHLFNVDKQGNPRAVAGVPPDYFSEEGQRWGNPLYNWAALKRSRYHWWVQRLRVSLQRFDVVRLDHFIGFTRFWSIPNASPTARSGQYVPGPGIHFFKTLEKHLGGLPFIAEDLGVVTPAVKLLRDRLGLPGMRVLQFAFGNDPESKNYQPHHYPNQCVVYTGTHDNDTIVGWYRDRGGQKSTRSPKAIRQERRFALEYLNSNGRDIHWDMIREAMRSPACIAIVPAQDLLGLGSEARMNRPGVGPGNWRWRLSKGHLNRAVSNRLLKLTRLYGRANKNLAENQSQ